MLIHADPFVLEVTERTSVAGLVDDIATVGTHARIDEALLAFTAVEKADESDGPAVARQPAAKIRTTVDKVCATRVMVYPYAHLSADLAAPRPAAQVVEEIAEVLREQAGLQGDRAPFGYYKAYDIACKGRRSTSWR